jgi:hypothetical protein
MRSLGLAVGLTVLLLGETAAIQRPARKFAASIFIGGEARGKTVGVA